MSTIVIVGAGLSGLVAANSLMDSGHEVIVLDKGRSVGGRLATRRIDSPNGGTATFDHGAQFFTVRSDEFTDMVRSWTNAGIVREWCRGFAEADGHPRYVVNGGMTALAKHLSRGVNIRTSTLVFSIDPAAPNTHDRWIVSLDDGTSIECDAVITTCPVPQSYSLTAQAGIEVPHDLLMGDYDRTIALLAVLDRSSALPAPGGVQNPDDVYSWICDNFAKGVSELPALTCHANPRWSAEHWDDDASDGTHLLTEHIGPYLGDATIVVSQYKKWRFATPRHPWSEPYWAQGSLVFAGDAFAGPKVEGAALSGSAASRYALSVIGRRA